MDKKTAICLFLRRYHTGRERAIYSRELERLFAIDGRSLRRKISSLRQEGYPICSGETGYYYGADIPTFGRERPHPPLPGEDMRIEIHIVLN